MCIFPLNQHIKNEKQQALSSVWRCVDCNFGQNNENKIRKTRLAFYGSTNSVFRISESNEHWSLKVLMFV